ncbi:hypothetical protein ACJRO7_001618 [Eucalyptus globulus]|uniref:F-box domain-containing protein n=1 Tax=Eucalyptus globulus TaxID=34317 RepID=A0ABD3LSK5_EUCGL
MESEPGSGSQSKKGRSDCPSDHSPSPSHGVAVNALPRVIVVDILSRLPTPSLFRAQFVCRSWRALARDPLLLQLRRPRAASSHDPSLVFRCDHPLRSQLYFVDDVSGGDGRSVLSQTGALDIWVMKESWVKDYSIGSYLPKGLQNHDHEETDDPSCKISRTLMRNRDRSYVRVLGMLRNGQILLEYHNRALVRYDPNHDQAVDLMFEGLPKWFESVVHVSTISSI